MRVIFSVDVISRDGTPHIWFTQEFDLEVQPQLGVPVEHVTWHEPRAIKGMPLNLEEQSLFVRLEPERASEQQPRDVLTRMYESHGWKTNP